MAHHVRKQVGIWIRVSTEDQAQGESTEHHEYRCRSYAEFKEWDIVKVYDLSAVSGKSMRNHPTTKEMLEDVRMGRISGLIFSKLARLARNTRELLEFADIFREYNADLISLQEAIDTSTPAGRLFYTMIAAMAEWEREEISARVAASVPVRAELGKSTGGQAPFGYTWVDRRIQVDPNEAPIVKRLFQLFQETKRRKTVADRLNSAGYRTRRGGKFSDTSVTRILENPIYKGKHRRNYTKSLGEGKHWEVKQEEDWIWNDVEPIVSEDLWDQINAYIQARKAKRNTAVGRSPRHLFSGLTFCHCGKKMYVHSGSPKYICKTCRNKIPEADLEKVFISEFEQFWKSPKEVELYLSNAESIEEERQRELDVLTHELDEARATMDKTYKLYLTDEITTEGFGKVYKPLEEREKQLEEEIARLEGEIDYYRIQSISRDQVQTEAVNIYSLWPSWGFKEKRGVVDTLVSRIDVHEDTVVLKMALAAPLPPFKEAGKSQRIDTDSSKQST